jgi:hypothetical protein
VQSARLVGHAGWGALLLLCLLPLHGHLLPRCGKQRRCCRLLVKASVSTGLRAWMGLRAFIALSTKMPLSHLEETSLLAQRDALKCCPMLMLSRSMAEVRRRKKPKDIYFS